MKACENWTQLERWSNDQTIAAGRRCRR